MTAHNAGNGPPRDPRMSGAAEAMQRAAAAATRRAARTRAAVSRPAVPASLKATRRTASVIRYVIGRSLNESERTLIWVGDNIKWPDSTGHVGQQAPHLGRELSAQCHRAWDKQSSYL